MRIEFGLEQHYCGYLSHQVGNWASFPTLVWHFYYQGFMIYLGVFLQTVLILLKDTHWIMRNNCHSLEENATGGLWGNAKQLIDVNLVRLRVNTG